MPGFGQCHTDPEVFPRGLVVDDEAVAEVFLEPVVEFFITEAGQGRGGAEADLARVVETGGEEEVAGAGAEGLQDRFEVGG
jgi:hypothetical protein